MTRMTGGEAVLEALLAQGICSCCWGWIAAIVIKMNLGTRLKRAQGALPVAE
jgi:hypothetical protein